MGTGEGGAADLDMKRDWDARARTNARYFIASTNYESEAVFRAQGERDVRHFFEGVEELLGPERELVDIGCGIGRMDEFLAPRVKHLTGVDVSGEMVRQARARLKHLGNVTFVECDGFSLPLSDASADTIYSLIVFQHVPRPVAHGYLREAFRVLRPGGGFLFQVPEWNPRAPVDPPENETFEMRFWREDELRPILDALGFRWHGVKRHPVTTPALDFDQMRVHVQKA